MEFEFSRHTAPATWHKNIDLNLMFLKYQENYFNDLLACRGHVFVNEVLDSLGLARTKDGQLCGWTKGEKIDFGCRIKHEAISLWFNCRCIIDDAFES